MASFGIEAEEMEEGGELSSMTLSPTLPPASLPPSQGLPAAKPPPAAAAAAADAEGPPTDEAEDSKGEGASVDLEPRPQSASTVLEGIRRFEQARRRHFQSQLEANSLYWESFVALVRHSQANSSRCKAFVKAKIAAGRAQAAVNYSIRDTVEGDKPGTNKARLENIRKEGTARRLGTRQPQQEHEDGEKPRNALDEMFAMEEKAAYASEQLSSSYERDVMPIMTDTIDRISQALDDLVEQGTELLSVVTKLELGCQDCYAACDSGSASSREGEGGGASPSTDPFLGEVNYKVAVRTQQLAWEQMSECMGGFFSRMKDLESERRIYIREALSVICKRQEELWRSCLPLKDPVLLTLERVNVDRRYIEVEITDSTRQGAARLKATGRAGAIGAGEAGEAGGGGGGGGPGEAASLKKEHARLNMASPLDSALVQHTQCVERKSTSVLGLTKWCPCILVVTSQEMVHLFDLPVGIEAMGGGKKGSQEAFMKLIPQQQATDGVLGIFISEEQQQQQQQSGGGGGGAAAVNSKAKGVVAKVVKSGSTVVGKSSRSPVKPLSPTLSINLRTCQVDDVTTKGVVELVEMVSRKGVIAAFGVGAAAVRHSLRGDPADPLALQQLAAVVRQLGGRMSQRGGRSS